MPGFDPTQVGLAMDQLVSQYRAALFPHPSVLVLIELLLWRGNRYRKAFTVYFTLNYLWLLIFVGGWFSVLL